MSERTKGDVPTNELSRREYMRRVGGLRVAGFEVFPMQLADHDLAMRTKLHAAKEWFAHNQRDHHCPNQGPCSFCRTFSALMGER